MSEILSVGVSDYKAKRYNDLPGAINDAARMLGFFEYGLPSGHCFDSARLLANPTAAEVLSALRDACAHLGEGSTFVFYFAGHGLASARGQQLLCGDADEMLADGYDAPGALSTDTLRVLFRSARCNLITIYDVCRADVLANHRGTAADGGARLFRDASAERPDASLGGAGERWSLISCGDGQRATDDGSFVTALLDEMKATLAQGQDLEVGSGLATRVRKRLMNGQHPEQKGDQFLIAPGKVAASGSNVDLDALRREIDALKRENEELRRRAEEERLRRRVEELERQKKSDEKPTPRHAPGVFVDGMYQSFVRIEPGSFMMGNILSPDEIVKRWGGEKRWYENAPRHRVELTRPYYMGKYQVTRGDFAEFVKATGYKTTAEKEGSAWAFDLADGKWKSIGGVTWRNPNFSQDDGHPVVCVSWHDAQKYIAWLNETRKRDLPSGFRYALPTEAQWEYACRAGTDTEFFWGTNEAKDGEGYLNAADETGAPDGRKWNFFFPFKNGYTATSPVGAFKPNNWGLYDMLGNALEWCRDWYGDYPRKPVVDPTGSSSGSRRVLRGGSWCSSPRYCRSAYRDYNDPAGRRSSNGFRLAMTGESALS